MRIVTPFLLMLSVSVTFLSTVTAGQPLRIMAFNVECLAAPAKKVPLERYRFDIARKAHIERVAAIIESLDPDIVNLEEVTSRESVESLVAVLHAKGLKAYQGYHVEGHDKFTGFDVALISKIKPDEVDGQLIQAVFSPFGEDHWREHYSFVGDSGHTVERDTSISRNALYYITIGGHKLGFLGLHLKSNPEDVAANAQRSAEAHVAQRAIRERIVGRGYLPIVLGDLNDYDPDVPDRDGTRKPVTQVIAGLKDYDTSKTGPELFNVAQRITREQDRYTSHWDRNENGAADPEDVFTMIDHILLPNQLAAGVRKVLISHATGLDTSDHYPVIVDIDLGGVAPAQQTAGTEPARQTAAASQLYRDRSQTHQEALYANLWVQTSAEYAAVCIQTYNAAAAHVASRLEKGDVGSDKLRRGAAGKPLAVSIDLDETVLDNSKYQTWLYDNGARHSSKRFDAWVSEHTDQIGLVPGAAKFIQAVEARGVTVSFISNRSESIRAATIETLARLGVSTQGCNDPQTLRLLLMRDDTSKQGRRDAVQAKFDVVAYVGDNLGDFSDEFRPVGGLTAVTRRQRVVNEAPRWGSTWFILPNPVYGDWQKLIGQHPQESLVRTEP